MEHTINQAASQCQLLIVLDRQVALESLVLNRLDKIPAYRQQEWLRTLLLDGFRLACHALFMTPRAESSTTLSEAQDKDRSQNYGVQRAADSESPVRHSVVEVRASFSTDELAEKGGQKPFAQLRKVMG